MLLVCVMSLIQNEQVNLIHLNVTMHQQVIKLPGYENKDIVVAELLDPVFILVDLLVIFPA